MKLLLNLFFVVTFLSFSVCTYSQWDLIYSLPAPGYAKTPHFSFSNPQNGWAAYVNIGSPSGDDYLAIVKSNNFGITWTESSNLSGSSIDATNISTLDSLNVYFTGNNPFFGFCRYSHDGGAQWTDLPLGSQNYSRDAFLLDSETLFISTVNNQTSKLMKFFQGTLSTLYTADSIAFNNSKIFFLTQNIGYIIAKDLSNNSILLQTNDGGTTFLTKYSSASYNFRNIHFTSDSTGYICCDSGVILKTIDFGSSFTELSTSNSNNLYDIQFVNDSCGYAVGQNGTCIYTTNFGATWTSDSMSTNDLLKSVQLFSMENGYILGVPSTLTPGFKLWNKNDLSNLTELKNGPFNIYPNPTSDYFTIRCQSDDTIHELVIYSALGDKVFFSTKNERIVNVSNFEKGLYFVVIKINDITHIRKIVKQ